MDNPDLRQIGKIFGNKFKINKYEERNHLLRQFNGWGDGFGLNKVALRKLKILRKIIYIFYFKVDETSEVYVSSPDNWITKGKEFRLSKHDDQFFLALDDFEIIYPGIPENYQYEELRNGQQLLGEIYERRY